MWHFRLEGLQALADKILSECDRHDTSLVELERRVQEFAESSTVMDPQEAARMAGDIQKDIDVSTWLYISVSGLGFEKSSGTSLLRTPFGTTKNVLIKEMSLFQRIFVCSFM